MTIVNIRAADQHVNNVELLDKLVADLYLTNGRISDRAKDVYRELKEILRDVDNKTD